VGLSESDRALTLHDPAEHIVRPEVKKLTHASVRAVCCDRSADDSRRRT
jgi:hypothetical protein